MSFSDLNHLFVIDFRTKNSKTLLSYWINWLQVIQAAAEAEISFEIQKLKVWETEV